MSEKTRYSDEELQEFKEIILKKLEKAQADYELLKLDELQDSLHQLHLLVMRKSLSYR